MKFLFRKSLFTALILIAGSVYADCTGIKEDCGEEFEKDLQDCNIEPGERQNTCIEEAHEQLLHCVNASGCGNED